MAFTYDITTNRGRARLAMGDTASSAGILPDAVNFTDAEVDAAMTLTGSWQKAAVFLLRAAVARWNVRAASVSIGGYSESRQQVSNLSQLADTLEAKLPGQWTGMGLGVSLVANPIEVVE